MIKIASLVVLVVLHLGNGAKKSVLDYSDVDVERVFQQWEENDEETDDEGDLPQETNPIDLEALKSGQLDPQEMIKLSKKNKPVMMFIGVRAGDPPDKSITDRVSTRWVQSLQNAHLQLQRYTVADDRVLFLIQDGSTAWDVKDYLITQTDCTTISFEQLNFDCASQQKKTEL